jgi:hypothetical protein
MPFTNYLNQKLVQLVFGDTAYAIPSNLWYGLSTTTPTQVATSNWNFTEPSGNNYSRPEAANNTTNFVENSSPPTNGWSQANGTVVTFPLASGSWGTCTYFGIFDAATVGNLLGYGQLTVAQTPISGDTPAFAVQALTITNT